MLVLLKGKINHVGSSYYQWALILILSISTHATSTAQEANTLDQEVRTTLASAVEFFKKRSKEDEQGWVVPPTRTRKVVDHEVVTYNYREMTREVPVYEYEYETYEVVQKVRVGDSSAAVDTYRKVKKRRVVSRKQVGVKKLKHLVRDPNGSITRDHRIPKYGPGGPDVWERYALGDNALALYALRRAGVAADDVTISQLANNLTDFIIRYGYPDETWDLAWLTAAFSTMPYEHQRKHASALASKLLDGQIRDGDAAGLWGPVAINTELLAEQLLEVEKLSLKLVEAKKEAAKEKRKERAYAKIDKAYRDSLANLLRIATYGMAGHSMEIVHTLKADMESGIRLPGLFDYIYNQRTADLDSTAVALYALRQAAENGTLPEKLWRPDSSKIEPEKPSKLLSACMDKLAKKLVEKRDWDEMNHYQAVKDFNKIRTFPGLPRADVPFPQPASGTSLLTTMQGFSSMAGAAHVAQSDALSSKYRKHMEKGSTLFRASAEKLLKNTTPEDSKFLPYPIYQHYFYLSGITMGDKPNKEDRRDLWHPLASKLLSLRSDKGSWEHTGPGRRFHFPTSLIARLAVMDEPEKKSNKIEYDKPHVYWRHHAFVEMLQSGKKLKPVVEDVVPTSLAMIFLAENVRPPVIGECLWTTDTKESRIAPVVTTVMRQQKKTPFRYSAAPRPIKAESIAELPVLLIRGKGEFDPKEEENKALKDYLDAGGLILFEATADSNGTTFLKGAESIIKSLLPASSKLEDIGTDKELMGSAVGKAKIKAIRKPDRSLAAVFLPMAAKSGAKGLTRPIAGRAVYNILFQKIDPEMLEESYPISGNHEPKKS